MASLERQILERVQNRIQTVNGAGSYTYDLSTADQVVFGDRFSPDRLPGVYINMIDTTTKQEAGRTVLSRYDREMKVQIEMWAGVTSSTPGLAMLEGADLFADVRRSIESDRSLNNLVRDVESVAASMDGSAAERPGLAFAVMMLTIKYTETAGA